MHGFVAALLLLLLVTLVAPACLYLGILTLAAPFGLRRRSSPSGRLRRFAVLVPAHNEATVIDRLLQSLQALRYPAELVDICVVADNCSDDTATIARRRGALVFERNNTEQRGKGYALNWLLEQLKRTGRASDAYVVIDADSAVSPDFLAALNARMDQGARVVQAYYAVLPVRGAVAESLREAALALVHYLRPAAKMAIGASGGLKGNGMCFDRSVIERFGWPTAGLAEDVEYHLLLVSAGIRVIFAPEAVVRAEMPASLAGARSQNMRWEAGRLTTLRRQALPLLLQGLRRRDIPAIDAALEQIMPPLSVPVVFACLGLLAGGALGLPAVWVLATVLLAIVGAYVLAGLLLARVPPRVYRALAFAPVYIGWKVLLYGRALLGRRERSWIRTDRTTAG